MMSVKRRDKLRLIRQHVARRKTFFRYQMKHLDKKEALWELEVWEAIERDYQEDVSREKTISRL